MLKLYKVERTDKCDYDEYDSFVCVAKSEEDARHVSPDRENAIIKDGVVVDDKGWWTWLRTGAELSSLEVTYLGELDSNSEFKEGDVVLASFNAG